jgi:hypothetical protein
MKSRTRFALAPALMIGLAGSPAYAATNRIWVSGHGSDGAGCGAVTAPCRQIQYVLANNLVAPGGEIDILDPSGFAPFAINQAISIVNDGVGTASIAPPAGTPAIDINAAASDVIILRGLELNGLGAAADGIKVRNAKSLSMSKIIVQNFSSHGIDVNPAASFKLSITDSTFTGNGRGVFIDPAGDLYGTLSRVSANNNSYGLFVSGVAAPANARILVSAASCVFADNSLNGVAAAGSSAYGVPKVSLLAATVTGSSWGLYAYSGGGVGGVISIARSLVGGNNYGAGMDTGGFIYSQGDNAFRDSVVSDVYPGALTSYAPK